MHIDIHTEPPVTEGNDNIVWAITNDVELEASIPELLKALETRKFKDPGITPEEFKTSYVLLAAEKPAEQDLDYKEVAGSNPIPWGSIAEEPIFFNNRHLFLRKMTLQDEKYFSGLKTLEDDPLGPLPDEPPPGITSHPTAGVETGVGTTTADIPRYNEVQVSGQLPLQHLKISALSWKARPVKPTPGIRNRPLSSATMCPSCGKPFAMNIPDDLMKKKMLTTDMERELDNALEAQRSVLEGEKKILENEANDLKAALASINASLSRTRDDGEELTQLAEQQASWTKWMEGEIRQTKAEINQLGSDFENCLTSNGQLTGLVEKAISNKVESKYWNNNINKKVSAFNPAAGVDTVPIPPDRHNTYTALPPPAGNPKKERLREIVMRYYQRHNPAKVGLVETLVDEYDGKERELLSLMAQKYGDASILAYDPVIDDEHPESLRGTAVPGSSGYSAGPIDANEYLRQRSPSPPKVDTGRADRKIQALLGDFLDEGVSPGRPVAQPSVSVPSPPVGVKMRPVTGLSSLPSRSSLTAPVSDPSRVTFNIPVDASPSPLTAPSGGYPYHTASPTYTDRDVGQGAPSLRDELMQIAPATMENRTKRGFR